MYRAISYCCGGSGGSPKRTRSVLCGARDCMELTESAAEDLEFCVARGSWGVVGSGLIEFVLKPKLVWRSSRYTC